MRATTGGPASGYRIARDTGRDPANLGKVMAALARHDAIVTCQGGDYTKQVLHDLRKNGWTGYWIDAARFKRMDDDSVIVLDPVNRDVIDRGIASGVKNYIGGNCTVSLMLMGLGGLLLQRLHGLEAVGNNFQGITDNCAFKRGRGNGRHNRRLFR